MRQENARTAGRDPASRWVVLNREQTKIIATGRTFEEAKQAAAAAGESSVLLAQMPPARGVGLRGRHFIYMVAVFISQVSTLGPL
jgi:hypothetical protein